MISLEKSERPKPKGDLTALALMIGMVVAVAVTGGASLSAAGSGALQQTLRTLGFGRDGEMQAEQRRQAATLSQIERIIGRMDNEIGALTTRVVRTEASESAAADSLVRLDDKLTALSGEVSELHARSEAAAGEPWRKPVDHLNAAVAGTRGDIITLRSSLDAYEQLRRNDVGAIAKRLDRLEKSLAARDATASIPSAPAQPPRTEGASGLMGLFGLRGSGSTDAGTGHVMDLATPGH
jgi:hypothetical protein